MMQSDGVCSEMPPEVGESVMHYGRPARVKKVNPDGTYELEYHVGEMVTASADNVERVQQTKDDLLRTHGILDR